MGTTPENDTSLEEAIFAGADREDLTNFAVGDRGDTPGTPAPASEGVAPPDAPKAEAPPAEPAGEPPAAPVAEPPAEPKASPSEPRIPKSRFDAVNERRKAAEARLAEYERQQQAAAAPAAEYDFDAKEREFIEATLDGETDKALAIRREIREAEQAAWRAQVEEASSRTREATKAEIELNETIAELQNRYPVFNGDAEGFNEELTREALDLFEGFKFKGHKPSVAMRKAVRYVVAANGLENLTTELVDPVESKSQQATPQQVQKKLDLATQQPPDPTGTAAPPPPTNLMDMTDAEFDALSEAELRKYRGDLR